MNVFEIVGQAQMLRDESNRALAIAIGKGTRKLFGRIGQFFGRTLSKASTDQQVRHG